MRKIHKPLQICFIILCEIFCHCVRYYDMTSKLWMLICGLLFRRPEFIRAIYFMRCIFMKTSIKRSCENSSPERSMFQATLRDSIEEYQDPASQHLPRSSFLQHPRKDVNPFAHVNSFPAPPLYSHVSLFGL